MYLFLDESGDIKGKTSKCFIICAFKTGNKRRIEKEFIKWQRECFPRKLKYQNEVKFTDRLLNERLRLSTIEFLIKQDPAIFYSYIKPKNIPKEFRKRNKVHETGKLYGQLVADTLNLILPSAEKEFRLFTDKRNLKGITNTEFKELLRISILPKLTTNALLQIELVDSTTVKGIQIADWLCGAVSRYLEKKTNGEKYFALLKNNIIKETELFKDYWNNLHNKK